MASSNSLFPPLVFQTVHIYIYRKCAYPAELAQLDLLPALVTRLVRPACPPWWMRWMLGILVSCQTGGFPTAYKMLERSVPVSYKKIACKVHSGPPWGRAGITRKQAIRFQLARGVTPSHNTVKPSHMQFVQMLYDGIRIGNKIIGSSSCQGAFH